jgi:hypothetical protein
VEGGWGPNRLEGGAQLAPGEKLTIDASWDETGDHHIDIKVMNCSNEMLVRRYDAKFTSPGVNEWTIEIPAEPPPTSIPTSTSSSTAEYRDRQERIQSQT